jgi:hypothetical protein
MEEVVKYNIIVMIIFVIWLVSIILLFRESSIFETNKKNYILDCVEDHGCICDKLIQTTRDGFQCIEYRENTIRTCDEVFSGCKGETDTNLYYVFGIILAMAMPICLVCIAGMCNSIIDKYKKSRVVNVEMNDV